MNIKYRLLCKRLIEERKRVGVIQYYNVLFIMELVSDKDIWALEQWMNGINNIYMKDIHNWCRIHFVKYHTVFVYRREYPPYPQPHTVWGKATASSGCSPSAPCAEKERTSLSRSPLFLLIFCCAEAIIPLPASPSRQRQPSPVRRQNTARSARSASRTSRGTGSWSAGQWRSSSALPRGTRPR